MNHFRKKAAIEKYAELNKNGATKEELMEALTTDEKEYSTEEVAEIYKGLHELNPASLSPIDSGTQPTLPNPESETHYQEWDVKVVGKTPEKLKIVRPVVKITEEEATILNEGVLLGDNTYGKMYFLPEIK